MHRANSDVHDAVKTMTQSTDETAQDVNSSAALMGSTGEKTRRVQDLSQRTETVSKTLTA